MYSIASIYLQQFQLDAATKVSVIEHHYLRHLTRLWKSQKLLCLTTSRLERDTPVPVFTKLKLKFCSVHDIGIYKPSQLQGQPSEEERLLLGQYVGS